ncbi:MAG: hypothetical protein JNJ73_13960 [Hyphomonadaceae bacterium]|nr:hypothetical protein [Hyphomonadaceae bacterium]
MDERAVRLWGVIVGGGCIAAALGVAVLGGPAGKSLPDETPPKTIARTVAPVAPDKRIEVADASDVAAPAVAPTPAQTSGQSLSFLIAFAPGHPLKAAQDLEAQGRHAQAVEAVRAALQANRDLRGLCYDRFTLGGAEIVLRLCTPAPASEAAAVQRRWTTRLAAMNGVQYAEPNVVAQPERRRR